MKKIAIIGGGQGGLHLGFGLLEQGHQVTLYNDRSPGEILSSRLPSTAYVFNEVCQMEYELGLNFWEEESKLGEGMLFDFREPSGQSLLTLVGHLHERAGRAMDQRTKFSRWMQEFERRGGSLVIQTVTQPILDDIAKDNDIAFVASGRSTLNSLFERDAQRSLHEKPPRHITAMVLHNPALLKDRPWPRIDFRPLRFNFIRNEGEFFSLPFYSHIRGDCRSFLFEARPGSSMDVFQGANDGHTVVGLARQILEKFAPDDAALFEGAELIDANAWLKGEFTPTVRNPLGHLPSGRVVMGIGDTVCLNDPIASQGANNASRMANHILSRIAHSSAVELDASWMQHVFDTFWEESAQYATSFTNTLLQDPSDNLLKLLSAASQNRSFADHFVRCFERPDEFWPWIADPLEADKLIAQHKQAPTLPLYRHAKTTKSIHGNSVNTVPR